MTSEQTEQHKAILCIALHAGDSASFEEQCIAHGGFEEIPFSERPPVLALMAKCAGEREWGALARASSKPFDPDDRSLFYDGQSPLLLAATHGNKNGMQALVSLGANPFAKNHDGHGVAMESAISENPEAFSYAVTIAPQEIWEAPPSRTVASPEDFSDKESFSPDNPELFRDMWNCLHACAQSTLMSGSIRLAALAAGPERTASALSARAFFGETPLEIAISHGNPDCALELLKAGADPNESFSDKSHPLLFALSLGNQHTVRIVSDLISFGSDPNSPARAPFPGEKPGRRVVDCGFESLKEPALSFWRAIRTSFVERDALFADLKKNKAKTPKPRTRASI